MNEKLSSCSTKSHPILPIHGPSECPCCSASICTIGKPHGACLKTNRVQDVALTRKHTHYDSDGLLSECWMGGARKRDRYSERDIYTKAVGAALCHCHCHHPSSHGLRLLPTLVWYLPSSTIITISSNGGGTVVGV